MNRSEIGFTGRSQADNALRASEARYRSIFESAAVSIWIEDFTAAKDAVHSLAARGVEDLREHLNQHPDELDRLISLVRIVDVNQDTLRLFEAGGKQQLLESLHRIAIPETKATFIDEFVALANGEPFMQSETVIQTLAGHVRHVVFTMSFPPLTPGLEHVVVTLLDVTDRKLVEEARAQERENLYSFLMQAPAPICVIRGPELVVELANQLYVDIAGKHVVGRPLREALSDTASRKYEGLIRDVMRTGVTLTEEEALISLERNGGPAETYFTFVYAPLRNSESAVDRVMVFANDVTNQVLARRDQEKAATALKQSNAMKDEFLGLVSHELRTPLATIFGNALMLSRRADRITPQQKLQSLEDIASEAQELHVIVEHLLLLTRVDAQAQLDLVPVDLSVVVSETIGALRRRGATRPISVAIGPDVPPVRGDPNFLGEVLENILSNAIKYSPSETPVEISLERSNGFVDLSVRDFGVGLDGIDPEDLFQPFYRSPKTRDTTKGLGLGLAVCKRLVEAQEGSIRAESVDGGGSLFAVSLQPAGDVS